MTANTADDISSSDRKENIDLSKLAPKEQGLRASEGINNQGMQVVEDGSSAGVTKQPALEIDDQNISDDYPDYGYTDQIQLTESAALKICQLIHEEENLDLYLRIFITGGGCSGFQYGFSFQEPSEVKRCYWASKDTVWQHASFKVKAAIDPNSLMYLNGATIDYQSDLQGERFVIINPNAKTTCGCGSSFSID